MSNISEIIERLENIAKHAVHYVGEPPFIMSLDDGIALHEAIDLLKAQEPRVMTLEEVLPTEVVYAEDIDKAKIIPVLVNMQAYDCIVLVRADGPSHLIHPLISEYGKRWRCWTSRPTDEQRQAVKWK